eukprot:scaffold10952_cov148-Cylindrotheca_fusiformis.AAC.1
MNGSDEAQEEKESENSQDEDTEETYVPEAGTTEAAQQREMELVEETIETTRELFMGTTSQEHKANKMEQTLQGLVQKVEGMQRTLSEKNEEIEQLMKKNKSLSNNFQALQQQFERHEMMTQGQFRIVKDEIKGTQEEMKGHQEEIKKAEEETLMEIRTQRQQVVREKAEFNERIITLAQNKTEAKEAQESVNAAVYRVRNYVEYMETTVEPRLEEKQMSMDTALTELEQAGERLE